MTTVYDFHLRSLGGAPLDLAAYKGRPILIVNTASRCGFTPQYAGLQTLWETYKARGLVVLGVPSNDFGGQEPGSSNEIASFCQDVFDVDFPMTEKMRVRGQAAAPLFQWLGREAGVLGRPRWNFYKYLVGPDGQLKNWFFCFTPPGAAHVCRAIERTLAR
jgi:glutathione peroxidase